MGSITHYVLPIVLIILTLLYHVPPPVPINPSTLTQCPSTPTMPRELTTADCEDEDCERRMEHETTVGARTFVDTKKLYDVVIMGATGVTGKQVTKYLSSKQGLKLAIAGRNYGRLEEVKAKYGRHELKTMIVDSFDKKAVSDMVSSSRVVIALSGPYTKYGWEVVRQCAKSGVHYVDLSGEFFYQRKVIDELEDDAVSTGAKLVVAGGYDSTPFDLAANIAVEGLPKVEGGEVKDTRVVAVTEEMHGYLSGGTLASMIVGVTDAIQETLQGKGSTYANDPYILTPKIQPCEKLDVDPTGWGNLPRYDRLVERWGIPHFMAYVNSRIVRRSMNLLGHTRVSYSEGMSISSLLDAYAWIVPVWLKGGIKLFPNPGEGPTEEVMEQGGFKVTTKAVRGDDVVKVDVVGKGDPGYGHTSKLISEIALCLSDDSCHHDRYPSGVGGVFTPSTCCGNGLRKGLEGILDFEVTTSKVGEEEGGEGGNADL